MAEKLDEIYVEVSAKLDKLEKELDELHRKVNKEGKKQGKGWLSGFKDGTNGITGVVANIAKAVAGAFVVKKILDFGRAGLQTAMDFEMLKSRIVALKGSQDAANKAFETYKKIAASTPFDLKGLTEAAATLEAFGMDSEKTLKTTADLAAFMGTSAPEAAAAWGRAFAGGAGAADIFREKGILTLIALKSGVDDVTKLSLPEFRKAMEKTFTEGGGRIAGATDTMSKTAVGGISNMKDAWDSFNNAIFKGTLPAINAASRAIADFLGKITPTISKTEEWATKNKEQRQTMDSLIDRYERLAKTTERSSAQNALMVDTVNELNSKFPEYIKNIDFEKQSEDEVIKSLREAQNLRAMDSSNNAIYAEYLDLKDQIAKKESELIELEKKRGAGGWNANEFKLGNDIKKVTEERIALEEKLGQLSADYKTILDQQKSAGEAIKGNTSAIAQDEAKVTAEKEKQAEIKLALSKVEIDKNDAERRKSILDTEIRIGDAKTKQSTLDDKILSDAERLVYYSSVYNQNVDATTSAWGKFVVEQENSLKAAGELGRIISSNIGDALSDLIWKSKSLSDVLSNAGRKIAEMAASKVFMKIADIATGGFLNVTGLGGVLGKIGGWLGLARGGTIDNIGGRPMVKAARGLDMMVPPGFNNDSFPVMVQSGERVQVTPAGKSAGNTVNNFAYSFSVSTVDPVGFERWLKTDGRSALSNTLKDIEKRSR